MIPPVGAGPQSNLRVVFDCMVFLQGAARRDSAAGACLALVERKVVDLYVSAAILKEIRDVLTRDGIRRKFPSLTLAVVNEFVAAIESKAVNVIEPVRTFEYSRDPKDEPYLNLAIAARADYLVSRDADILDLANPSNEASRLFRSHAPHVRIVEPAVFLAEIRHGLRLPVA